MVKFTYHKNSIDENEIKYLIGKIKRINTYGYIIKAYLEQEDFEVIFTSEESMFDTDSQIKDMVTRRGFAEDKRIVIHCTKYESVESIKWIFIHELGHIIIKKYGSVMALMYFVKEKFYKDIGLFNGQYDYYSQVEGWNEEYHKDEVHESDPEEILVSSFATNLIGFDYSRHWWRNNIKYLNKRKE